MKKRGMVVCILAVVITAAVNAVSWQSTAFCDMYAEYVYPLWVNTLGRFSGMFSFSVGEIMIVTGLLISAVAALLAIIALTAKLFCKNELLKKRLFAVRSIYFRAYGILLTGVFVVMTLNCFILYHATGFSDRYMQAEQKEYSFEELALLRNYIVAQANSLSAQVERDESGRILCDKDKMIEEAKRSMQNLGTDYSRLAGYYPNPKELNASAFLSQQYMQGYFFPFSMEANYNGVMYSVNMPVTMCHELAHVKGFLYEDEANLIGFLACINSDDPLFQYSGYLSVLNYIDNDFYEATGKSKKIYKSYETISSKVKKDNVFLTEDAWVKVEQQAVVNTAVVAKISDEFLEANLVLNGVGEGIASYSNVVGLLLDYYDSNYGIMPQEGFLVQGK